MFLNFFQKLRIIHFNLGLLIVLLVLGLMASYYYWNQAISLGGFLLWIVCLLLVGSMFVFGIRISQKDGFVNGFKNGKDNLKKG